MYAAEAPPTVNDPRLCWETNEDAVGTFFFCDATQVTLRAVPSAPAFLLPLGWQVNVAPSGRPYFSRDAETSWTLPSGFVSLPEGAEIVNDLGVYWEAPVDPRTGKEYYYQESSGRTLREFPCTPVPPRHLSLRGKLPVVLPSGWYATAAPTGEVYFVRSPPGRPRGKQRPSLTARRPCTTTPHR
jgi:hypothetical protein